LSAPSSPFAPASETARARLASGLFLRRAGDPREAAWGSWSADAVGSGFFARLRTRESCRNNLEPSSEGHATWVNVQGVVDSRSTRSTDAWPRPAAGMVRPDFIRQGRRGTAAAGRRFRGRRLWRDLPVGPPGARSWTTRVLGRPAAASPTADENTFPPALRTEGSVHLQRPRRLSRSPGDPLSPTPPRCHSTQLFCESRAVAAEWLEFPPEKDNDGAVLVRAEADRGCERTISIRAAERRPFASHTTSASLTVVSPDPTTNRVWVKRTLPILFCLPAGKRGGPEGRPFFCRNKRGGRPVVQRDCGRNKRRGALESGLPRALRRHGPSSTGRAAQRNLAACSPRIWAASRRWPAASSTLPFSPPTGTALRPSRAPPWARAA